MMRASFVSFTSFHYFDIWFDFGFFHSVFNIFRIFHLEWVWMSCLCTEALHVEECIELFYGKRRRVGTVVSFIHDRLQPANELEQRSSHTSWNRKRAKAKKYMEKSKNSFVMSYSQLLYFIFYSFGRCYTFDALLYLVFKIVSTQMKREHKKPRNIKMPAFWMVSMQCD